VEGRARGRTKATPSPVKSEPGIPDVVRKRKHYYIRMEGLLD